MNREHTDSMQEAYEREAAHYREVAVYAQFCPKCGVHCGEADFEPDDPSVGIWGPYWGNTCPTHGEFVVFEDGDTEFD